MNSDFFTTNDDDSPKFFQSVFTVGDLRKSLSNFHDDCPIHSKEGFGLLLIFGNEPPVLFGVSDYEYGDL